MEYHKSGVHLSPQDERDYTLSRVMSRAAGSTEYPKKHEVWLPSWAGTIKQKANNCTGQALAVIWACIWHSLCGEELPFSVAYSYGNRRVTEYKDEGQIARDVFKAGQKYGGIPSAVWDSDSEVSEVIDEFESRFSSLEPYAKKLMDSYVKLPRYDMDGTKAFLCRYGIPVMGVVKTKYINPLSSTGTYHAMPCYGWDGEDLMFVNSWGKNKCERPKIHYEKIEELWGGTPIMAKTVTDIKGHWAQDAIQEALNDGTLNGYEDGTFKPDNPITRAEAAVILQNMKRYNEGKFEKNP